MGEGRHHYSDLDFASPYVRAEAVYMEGAVAAVEVLAECYSPDGRRLLGSRERFECDSDGFMTKRQRDLALFYGFGAAEAVRGFGESGVGMIEPREWRRIASPEHCRKTLLSMARASRRARGGAICTSAEELGCDEAEIAAAREYAREAAPVLADLIAYAPEASVLCRVGLRNRFAQAYEMWAANINRKAAREGREPDVPGVYSPIAGVYESSDPMMPNGAGITTISMAALMDALGTEYLPGMTRSDPLTLEDYTGRKLYSEGDSVGFVRIAEDLFAVTPLGAGSVYEPNADAIYITAEQFKTAFPKAMGIVATFRACQRRAPELMADIAEAGREGREGSRPARRPER